MNSTAAPTAPARYRITKLAEDGEEVVATVDVDAGEAPLAFGRLWASLRYDDEVQIDAVGKRGHRGLAFRGSERMIAALLTVAFALVVTLLIGAYRQACRSTQRRHELHRAAARRRHAEAATHLHLLPPPGPLERPIPTGPHFDRGGR